MESWKEGIKKFFEEAETFFEENKYMKYAFLFVALVIVFFISYIVTYKGVRSTQTSHFHLFLK